MYIMTDHLLFHVYFLHLGNGKIVDMDILFYPTLYAVNFFIRIMV